MKVIGIAGGAGSGKNTVGGLLAAVLSDQGYSVALDGFATAIKQQLREEFGWPGVKNDFWRQALQVRGAFGRAADLEYWIRIIEKKWGAGGDYPTEGAPDFLILTDVRYKNEAEWCRRYGVCWLVEGRGGLEGDAGEHASETELLSGPKNWIGAIVVNLSDLEALVTMVRDRVACGRHLQSPAGKDLTS